MEGTYLPMRLANPPGACLTCAAGATGFRGGFIFPLFFAGTAFGQALATIPGIPFFSSLPPVLLAMTMASGAPDTTRR